MNPPDKYMTDPARLQEVRQTIASIQGMLGATPGILEPDLREASEVFNHIKNRLECLRSCEDIVRAAKVDPKNAAKMLVECQQLIEDQTFIAHSVLRVYENDPKNLINSVKYLEEIARDTLSLEIVLKVIKKIHEAMCVNGHNFLPAVIVLKDLFNVCLEKKEKQDSKLTTLKGKLERDASQVMQIIATEIADGAQYPVFENLISIHGLLIQNLDELMGRLKKLDKSPISITQKLVTCVTRISHLATSSVIIDVLRKDLDNFEDDDCLTERMILWAHMKNVSESSAYELLDKDNPLKSAVDKHLKSLSLHINGYVKVYEKLVEHTNCYLLDQTHQLNQHLHQIIPIFITKYYDTNLQKVHNLLRASRLIGDKYCCHKFLNQIHEMMCNYQQDQTFEFVALYCLVKEKLEPLERDVNEDRPLLKTFRQLKSTAPSCLALLIWQKELAPHGICISNKLGTIGVLEEGNVVCGQNTTGTPRRISSVWQVVVSDSDSGLVYFKTEDEENSPVAKFLDKKADAKGHLVVGEVRSQWRIRALDQNTVQICSTAGKFYFLSFKCENFSSKGIFWILRSF